MKYVLFNNSNTQRITVHIKFPNVLLNKEYRKSSNENWKTGKGILIPIERLIVLSRMLETNFGRVDDESYNKILSGLPAIHEEDNN